MTVNRKTFLGLGAAWVLCLAMLALVSQRPAARTELIRGSPELLLIPLRRSPMLWGDRPSRNNWKGGSLIDDLDSVVDPNPNPTIDEICITQDALCTHPSCAHYLRGVFSQYDLNGDGEVGAEELVQAMANWGVPVTQQEAQYMIDEIDLNGDGQMQFNEFVTISCKNFKAWRLD